MPAIDNDRAHDLWAAPQLARALEKHLGGIAEQHLANSLVMGVARLDLLREGVDVSEAPLERAPWEDRVDPGRLIGVVGDRDRTCYRIGAGESRPRDPSHRLVPSDLPAGKSRSPCRAGRRGRH
jgi:hypothetical protein